MSTPFLILCLLDIGATSIHLRRQKETIQHGGGRSVQMYITAEVTASTITLNIEQSDREMHYCIYDANGYVVLTGMANALDGKPKVPINGIPNGKYSIEVKIEGINYVGDFVTEG